MARTIYRGLTRWVAIAALTVGCLSPQQSRAMTVFDPAAHGELVSLYQNALEQLGEMKAMVDEAAAIANALGQAVTYVMGIPQLIAGVAHQVEDLGTCLFSFHVGGWSPPAIPNLCAAMNAAIDRYTVDGAATSSVAWDEVRRARRQAVETASLRAVAIGLAQRDSLETTAGQFSELGATVQGAAAENLAAQIAAQNQVLLAILAELVEHRVMLASLVELQGTSVLQGQSVTFSGQ